MKTTTPRTWLAAVLFVFATLLFVSSAGWLLASPSEEITKAVAAGGKEDAKQADADTFLDAFSSLLVTVPKKQSAPYVAAATKMRPDLKADIQNEAAVVYGGANDTDEADRRRRSRHRRKVPICCRCHTIYLPREKAEEYLAQSSGMQARGMPFRLRTDTDADPHSHANTDTYSHADPDADANCDSDTNTHRDADANWHSDADAHRNTNSHRDANSNAHRDSNAHTNRDSNADAGASPDLLRLPEPRQLPHALLHAGKGGGVPEEASRVQDRSLSRRISDAADELLFPSRRPVGFRR